MKGMMPGDISDEVWKSTRDKYYKNRKEELESEKFPEEEMSKIDKIIDALEVEAICLNKEQMKTKEALWAAVSELKRIHNLEIISTEVLRQVQDTAIDKANEMEQEYLAIER